MSVKLIPHPTVLIVTFSMLLIWLVLYRLFENVNLFLKVAVHVGSPGGILLKEIFSGGPSISLKIREEQIIHMIQLIFKKNECETSSSPGLGIEARCAVLLALQELVKVHTYVVSYSSCISFQ